MVDAGEELSDNLGKYRVDYKVTGKNKVNVSTITYPAGTSKGSQLFVAKFKLKPNTNYTFSCKTSRTDDSDDMGAVKFLCDYDFDNYTHNALYNYCVSQGQGIVYYDNEINSRNHKYLYITTGSGTLNGEVTYSDMQLEEGNTATEYEPYK